MHLGFKRKFRKENCFCHTNQFLLDLLIVKSPLLDISYHVVCHKCATKNFDDEF